jgi:hypothetical protein
MKIVLIIFLCIAGLARFSWAQEPEPLFATITERNVLLYESPSTTSPIVRRIFPGEIIKIVETLKTEQGEVWGKVFISPLQVGYIKGIYFKNSGSLQMQLWKPEEVLRNKMPFSFALKGPSEFFGPGLQFRYLPFTRLGFTVGAGSVLDSGSSKGFSVAYGLTCLLSMGNFSPFVETGSSTLTFNDSHSTLRISTFYINAGVEWIISSGYFWGLGLNYNRSYNVQVAYDYAYAKTNSGSLTVGKYGSFSGVDGNESLQRLNPLLFLGYSF